jgi:hypothetical protein
VRSPRKGAVLVVALWHIAQGDHDHQQPHRGAYDAFWIQKLLEI